MAIGSCAATSALVALLLTAARHPHPPARPATTQPGEQFDFVVVGGGTAGCVVAARLSENPHWKVLVLEAGFEEPDISVVPSLLYVVDGNDDWHWVMPTQPSRGLDKNQVLRRAKMLGGCSAHNGMTYLRGNREDYNGWERGGARGWAYRDVLPVFKAMETDQDLWPRRHDTQYHGVHGPQYVQRPPDMDRNMKALLKVWTDSGLPEVDPNGESQLGAFIAQQSTGFGQRYSTNRAYLQPARHRSNLRVVTGATVTRVHIDADSKEARHVEYTDSQGNKHSVRVNKEVILSGGTYGSPQVLLLSGVGPAAQLQAAGIPVLVDSPSVGRHLQDHFSSDFLPLLNLSTSARVPASRLQVWLDALAFLRGSGPFTNMGPHKVGSLQRSPLQPENDTRPYVQMYTQGGWRDTPRVASFCSPINQTTSYYDQVTGYVVVIHPSSAGYLELNTTSPGSTPLIYQNVFSEEVDIKIQASATRSLYALYRDSQILRELGAEVYIPDVAECAHIAEKDSDEYFECGVRHSTCISLDHPVGTCRMGDGQDQDAVVDSRLRVRGARRLRVVDASIFPTVTSGNTNAPTIMVAERAAQLIKADWTRLG